MATLGTGFAARVHRLWPLSEEGESSVCATTTGRLGICVPSVPTYVRRSGSTSLLALAEGRAAGVAGQDMGTGGRLVRVDREDRGELQSQP